MRSEGFYVNEKSTDTRWDRNSDLPICNSATTAASNGNSTYGPSLNTCASGWACLKAAGYREMACLLYLLSVPCA